MSMVQSAAAVVTPTRTTVTHVIESVTSSKKADASVVEASVVSKIPAVPKAPVQETQCHRGHQCADKAKKDGIVGPS